MAITQEPETHRPPRIGSAPQYLVILLAASCLTIFLLIGLLYAAQRADVLPPVPLSNSAIFNEKAAFVRDALHFKQDIVVAGSSMAVNNLAGDTLAATLPGRPRILNIGSFSMKISDTRRWLDDVLRLSRPKSVILVTGMMDFTSHDFRLTTTDDDLVTFLAENRLPDARMSRFWEIIRSFSLLYYATNNRGLRASRRSRKTYASVDFDHTGSVPLEIYFPHVDRARWDRLAKGGDFLNEDEYEQLTQLGKELRSRGINLILVQAPLRRRALEAGRADLQRHWQRLEEIASRTGCRFLDLHTLDYDDSFFADYSHLNTKGAHAFTRELAHRLGPSVP